MSPKLYGFLKTVGLVVVFAVLTWLANASNLGPYLSPTIGGFIAALAGMLEEDIKTKTNTGLMGSVQLR